jgi:heme exporter protein C
MMAMSARFFGGLLVLSMIMFVGAPILIAGAPYESTMGLIQKVFYFHVPSWIAMFLAVFICGISSGIYLFKGKASADRVAAASAELAVLFGAMGLMTGPLWAIKAWGVWWQWDARLTMALILELIFIAYMLLRAYGGPGSEKLAAGLGLFGLANVPFVYISVNVWRTIHPTTDVLPNLSTSAPGMFGPIVWCLLSFLILFVVLLTARIRLEEQRAKVEALYLALEA